MAGQVTPTNDVDGLLAEQPASDALAPRQPERTDRPGRGSLHAPDWLGQRPLPLGADGFGEIQPTPFELIDRRFAPSSYLRRGGATFESTVGPVPPEVLARSTWQDGCPVAAEDLSYLTVGFIGFDGASYVGEVIVNATAADAMVQVFRTMFETGFPIEEVRVIAPDELDAPPTGDGNVTTVFVCRPVTGGASWSQHAYGLAIDINPFHNPYVKGDLVLPELATVYTDRALGLPGMIIEGDSVVQAFDAIGWGWGGRWSTLTDPQHFSANGR
ncbi:MAG: M15 family metallopeptidase [Acidimicrobiia bacterium]|nr:M15 family metallopeptidase [Acidimicrobiia bacterium]